MNLRKHPSISRCCRHSLCISWFARQSEQFLAVICVDIDADFQIKILTYTIEYKQIWFIANRLMMLTASSSAWAVLKSCHRPTGDALAWTLWFYEDSINSFLYYNSSIVFQQKGLPNYWFDQLVPQNKIELCMNEIELQSWTPVDQSPVVEWNHWAIMIFCIFQHMRTFCMG